ncbi:hypothetical protein EsH8_I_000132 [Colletotrichum jinshuiense]
MSSIPQTYKAVILGRANSSFSLKDVDLKHPIKGQILVKVLACGVCYGDSAVEAGAFGDVFPLTPGHELIGDVVEIGQDVTGFQVGERVGGPWHGGHDGSCRQCQRGLFQMCDNAAINGVSRSGGFAEYVLLRAEAVVRVPRESDPAEVAPLLCAGVTVFNGIRKLHVEQGALVAVQGLGGLGHLAVQYASNMGYEVVAISSGDEKAQFAKELGAQHYINASIVDAAAELTKLGGASIIVQTAPNPKAVGSLIGGLAAQGKLLSLAPVGPAEVDTVALVTKGASVVGWPSGHALDSEEAIAFAIRHGIRCLIKKYPLADVQSAVDDLRAGFGVYHAPAVEKYFNDDVRIQREYYSEVEYLLRQRLPGVKKVVIFDHTIRRRDVSSVRQPVQLVHIDQTPSAAKARMHRHLSAEDVEAFSTSRFQIVNVWRPIKHPASDTPLAVIDWRSMAPEDLVKVDLLYPDPTNATSFLDSESTSTSGYEVKGEQYAVAPNKNHRFYYMKNMSPNEVMFIKCFDSESSQMTQGRTDIAHGSGHTAFIDPATPADAPARQSIEVRCLVFYNQ